MKIKRYVYTLKQFLRERVFFCQGFPYWEEPPYQPKVCSPPTFFPCIAKIPPVDSPHQRSIPPLDNNFVCSHCSCTSTSHCSCTIIHTLWTQFMLILPSSAIVTSGEILQICIMAYQHTKAFR